MTIDGCRSRRDLPRDLRAALHLVPESAKAGDYSTCSCGWIAPPGVNAWNAYTDHLTEVYGPPVEAEQYDGVDHAD